MTDYTKELERVQEMDFAMHEAALFLDNHPNNTEAMEYFAYFQHEATQARKQFEQKYGPLQYQSQANTGGWQWVEGPWPWESEV